VARRNAQPRGGGIPRELTSFVGRRRELREVKEALSSTPLLTLIGPAGVGKTRLALRAGNDVRRAFPDGVWVAELADLNDPALVAVAVAGALGLHDTSPQWLVSTLADFLASRQLCLILDNCEHLLDACAVLADSLLHTCPGLKILATSREALGVGGETVLQVQPLPVPEEDRLPPPEALLRYDAVRLFVERARAAWPQFELTSSNAAEVCTLCRRLDGLPLALELAAVRLRAFTVDQILDQMDRRFRLLSAGSRTESVRHQSMKAAIDWSFGLLSPQEQIVWQRLSVFAGSFDLEAAAAVCEDERMPPEAVTDLVASLVERSILRRELYGNVPRYRMLETIREYGRDRLRGSGDEPGILKRHRDHYADVSARVWTHSWGPFQVEWWNRAHLELPNLREAVRWCLIGPEEAERGLLLAANLGWYWVTKGSLREGRHSLDMLLAAAPTPSPGRAIGLAIDGWLALRQVDVPKSMELLAQSETLAADLGDREILSLASATLGTALVWQGELDRAQGLFERCLELQEGLPDRRYAAISLLHLGVIWSQRRKHSRAVDVLEQGLDLCREAGDRYYQAWILQAQGMEAWHMDDFNRAGSLAAESLRISIGLDNKVGMAFSVELLAWIAAKVGRAERAARLLGGVQTLWESIPTSIYAPYVRHHEAGLTDARSALVDRQFNRFYREGTGLDADHLAALALEEGEPVAARTSRKRPPTQLTPREREIAGLVAEGLSNKEIAAKLVISQRTAETHVEHILTKLGFTSRAQIAAWAVEEGMPPASPAPIH
jgi:predicted ATPase/DNA-binding CsgD family transcriptional regulator